MIEQARLKTDGIIRDLEAVAEMDGAEVTRVAINEVNAVNAGLPVAAAGFFNERDVVHRPLTSTCPPSIAVTR